MVTITSHVFVNIFQMVDFSAVKFTKGYEKNMSFLLIPKSPKVWQKSEAIGPGSFNRFTEISPDWESACAKFTKVLDTQWPHSAFLIQKRGSKIPSCFE